VELAHAALGELEKRNVLVIGAGENGELTARALHERGVSTVFVANRRYDRAIGLAQRFGGEAVRFDDLPAHLVDTDIVVSSTSSPHQLVGRDELALVMEQREGRSLLLIDIAVPRDIDPTVRDLPGITLYDMDDLQREIGRNMSVRESEATRARTLIEQDVEGYSRWLASLEVVPTITALRERGDAIVEEVLRENESRWVSLEDADRERVAVLARAVVQRLLHEPTLRLKGSVEDERSYVYVQALRELFGIEPPNALELDTAGTGAEVTDLESRRKRHRGS
jgi:glutamyl-tRNA reductase